MILANETVEARFDESSGALVHLSTPGGANLLRACGCRYVEDDVIVSDVPEETESRPFRVVSVTASHETVESVLASDAVEITRRFSLRPEDPLLTVRHTVRGTRAKGEILHPGFPRVTFSEDFADAFEDEADRFFDGAELGQGREMPCWRVFFRDGHEDGLLLATRSKYAMSHLQIYARGFDLKPHVMTAYDTDYILAYSPMRVAKGTAYTACFELGPWQVEGHEALLRKARLDQPQDVAGSSPARAVAEVAQDFGCDAAMESRIFDAQDLVDTSLASNVFERDRWLIADMPWCRSGKALFANAGTPVPSIGFDPGLRGLWRVFAGIGNGDGVVVRFSDEDMPVIRIPTKPAAGHTPFHLRLEGKHEAREVLIGVHRMDDCTLTIERFPSSIACTVLDYVRIELLSPDDIAAWEAQEGREPCIELSGLNDVPDISVFTDARDPDLNAYRANLWEHAKCGVRKVFWRIDGQCSDYASKVNTMRYICARVHGVFAPQAKAYGRALQRTDMLRLAVDAAGEHGLSLYGWMRFNNYSGNVQSDFFRNNPTLREESERGHPSPKLCLAHEAVRRHKIGILVEAARYGLDGLCLGFLRHPPVLGFAPILVQTYEEKYGCLPPRDLQNTDEGYTTGLPSTDEEQIRWFRHRAGFMTQFMRELRAALSEADLGHLAIAIWVRPSHCLFDGIDLDTWLDEGLCHEVIAHSYGSHEAMRQALDVPDDWKRKVQAGAKLSYGVYGWQPDMPQRFARAIAEGYDGICSYESDYTVLQNEFIALFRGLRT